MLVRKIIPAVLAGAAVLAVAGGAFANVTANKDVTLSVDGMAQDVTTTSGTVADFLDAQGIALSDHDVVAPAPETKLADGTRIAVQYGRQVTVTVDGRPQSFWTTATTVDDALNARRIQTAGAELSTSRSTSIGRQGLAFALATMKSVAIKVAAREHRLETTAQTVGQALTEARITVDADDIASSDTDAPLTDGMKLTVVKVEVEQVTMRRDVDYETVSKNSDDLEKGDTLVDREGKTGVRTEVYTEVRHDGSLKSRKKTSAKITREPTDKIVLVGTKEQPAAAADKSSSGSSGTPRTPGNSVWDRLAWCETGQRWNTDSVPGYSGGLGFAHSSWKAYGGSGSRAAGHSREEQIAVAKRILADVGWKAWPACSRKLGLR